MSTHRVSRLLLLVVIFLTPCSMAVESKKKKNKQVLNERKEKEEPNLGHFRARLKQEMQQVITLCCDDPPSVSSTTIPSNLPSSSPSFTEKSLPGTSALPSVYPTQVR